MAQIIIPAVEPTALDAYDAVLSKLTSFIVRREKRNAKTDVAFASLSILAENAQPVLKVHVYDNKPGASVTAVNEATRTKTVFSPPYYCFRSSVSLADGRTVFTVVSQGTSERSQVAPPAQAMDRDGAVTLTAVDPKVNPFNCCALICDPVSGITSYELAKEATPTVTLFAPQGQPIESFGKTVVAPCALVTFFSGPVCLACCMKGPPAIYKIKAADSETPLPNVSFTTFAASIPGNVDPLIERCEFTDKATLSERRNAIAFIAYMAGNINFYPINES
jgi:hypothetical protein